MLPFAEPVHTDFWGIVVPTWIAALGGFAATVLAIVSLVVAQRARSNTREVQSEADTTREVLSDTIEAVKRRDEQTEPSVRAGDALRSGMEDAVWNALLVRLEDDAPRQVRYFVSTVLHVLETIENNADYEVTEPTPKDHVLRVRYGRELGQNQIEAIYFYGRQYGYHVRSVRQDGGTVEVMFRG